MAKNGMADRAEVVIVAAAELHGDCHPFSVESERGAGFGARQPLLGTVEKNGWDEMDRVAEPTGRAVVVLAGEFARLDHRVEFGRAVEDAAMVLPPHGAPQPDLAELRHHRRRVEKS